MFLQETKCPGDDTHRSSKHYIVNCGRSGREPYGVAVILHFSLLKHIVAIRGVSQHIIYVQLKITGGLFSVVGVYAPHEGRPFEEKEAFYESLSVTLHSLSRDGPLGLCGDLNCKLNFRNVGEENIIGPHIFNPGPPPPAGGELQNRDLLVQLCSRYDLSVMNTFLPKREIQQVTFFDRRIDRWNSDSVDRVFHKQLDVFIVSRTSKHAVIDIRSKRDCRIGCTTHHLQVATIRIPIRKRERRGKSRAPLPWDIFQNSKLIDKVKKRVPNIFVQLCPALHLPLQQIVTLIDFDPINNDNYTDPLIIYFDGAFLQRKGGWAFLAVTWSGNIIFERWCAVCIDKQKSAFLGAHSLTNNTAELSAFGEALIWLICECNFPWRERGRFCL